MTITEVSKKYGLSADTLRYYERIGLIPDVTRNQRGVRDYSEEDCGWIEFVKCMRSAGLSIENLIKYQKLLRQGEETVEARKALLIKQRTNLQQKLLELQQTLEKLDYKIERYERRNVS